MEYLTKLKEIFPKDRISMNETVLAQHGDDETHLPPANPDVVVFPLNREEVSATLKIANEYKVAVTPFGVGSSLEGHVIPYEGGISLDMTMMNQIIEIRENDFLVKVQPGVTRTQLNEVLNKQGLFFPVDPGADATIGGMAATNASGTTTVKYGVMRDQVRDLEVVLADGSIINTGNLAEKSSSGYHLNSLFVGSEGTLGVFTEITLKIHGIPEHTMVARAVFDSVKDAVDSVVTILQAGIPIARCELVDEQSVIEMNKHSGTSYIEAPTLFLEFNGNESGLAEDVDLTKAILSDYACLELIFETDAILARKLWEVRHNLAYAFIQNYRGKKMMLTDVSVPISVLSDAILYTRERLDTIGLNGAILGHVGDGNFHTILVFDETKEADVQKALQFNEQIVHYALERGGTSTGEHGIGIGKKKYQAIEHGAAFDIMIQLKKMLDPNCILNPDKIIDKY